MPVELTDPQLTEMIGNWSRATLWRPHLNRALDRARVSSSIESAAGFLAQVFHESSYLWRLVENLNYSAAGLLRTFPNRVHVSEAGDLARDPERIANHVYGGRLGNILPGDGWRYRGRGPLQLTGRWNYRTAGEFAGQNFEDFPELVVLPEHGALCAAWFWRHNRIEERVAGLSGDARTVAVTKIVNGGRNGLEDRIAIEVRVRGMLEVGR